VFSSASLSSSKYFNQSLSTMLTAEFTDVISPNILRGRILCRF